MFDVLAFPEPCQLRPAREERLQASLEASLEAPIAAGPNDTVRVLRIGRVLHLGRWRPCCWQRVVHRSADGGCWTHLYRVVPEHGGRILVLLERAIEGEVLDGRQGFSA